MQVHAMYSSLLRLSTTDPSPRAIFKHATPHTGFFPQARPSRATRLLQCLRLSTPLPHHGDSVPLDGSARLGTFSGGRPDAPQPPLHLRVFRSVPLHDADMLVPGAVARFTLLDKLLIWVPILIGVGSAIYKIATSVRPALLHCHTAALSAGVLSCM